MVNQQLQTLENDNTKISNINKNRISRLRQKSSRQLLILCLPIIIKTLIFSIIPMLWLVLAFQDFIPHKGIFRSEFIGFDNFELLFRTDLYHLIKNAVILNVLSMIFPTVTSLLIGLLMFEIKKKLQLKTFQTILFFPFFISWPLVGTILMAMIGEETGMITNLVYTLTWNKVRFYDNPDFWRFILTSANVWKVAGVNAVLYYAVLLGNDPEMYEAADIDGAGRWKKMWFLSLPSLKLMILLGIITASANILRVDFSWIYYSTNNKTELYEVTETIEVYMFNALRRDANYMIGTAVGLVQSVVGLVLSFTINSVVKRLSPGSSLY